jgi:hypothetical protein
MGNRPDAPDLLQAEIQQAFTLDAFTLRGFGILSITGSREAASKCWHSGIRAKAPIRFEFRAHGRERINLAADGRLAQR